MSDKKYSQSLIDLVNDDTIKRKSSKCRNGTELGKLLIDETKFLKNCQRLTTRLWYVKNKLFEQVRCPVCNKLSDINIYTGKIKTCSKSCSRKKIDPETGLTLSAINAIKTKETLLKIDLITNESKAQRISRDRHMTMSEIDPETGLSGYQKAAKKSAMTMSKKDLNLGLSIYNKSHSKGVITKNVVNPTTGLTIYQESALKVSDYMNSVDETLNIKNSERIQNKRYNTLNSTTENGITRQKEINNNRHRVNYYNLIENFKVNFNEYKLLTTLDEFIQLDNKKNIKYIHSCGNIIYSLYPSIRCTKCYPYNKSIGEHEVLEFCQSLTNNIESNSRSIITPLELDIYLPDHKLAIEYNGLYYHSAYSIESESKDYHLNKTRLCQKQGIQLFHIFENEWTDPIKQNIWKSIIRNKLCKSERIFARKTEINLLSSKDKHEFLNSNHLQGNCSSSVNLGLYLDDELVSIMTFGRSRYDKKVEWELIRFCNKIGYSVIGGASKLLKAFSKDHSGSIISYADRRRSNGNLYEQLGFEFSHESGPNYWYYKDSMNLESRLKYQKHKLKDQLDIFDNDKTESENMYNNGYRKIYDCGNQVWILYNVHIRKFIVP